MQINQCDGLDCDVKSAALIAMLLRWSSDGEGISFVWRIVTAKCSIIWHPFMDSHKKRGERVREDVSEKTVQRKWNGMK